MADMNRRGNRSYFFLPPALCVRFPALRTCTENLVLSRPDNFGLVMSILEEVNQDIARSVDSATVLLSQRPRQQQVLETMSLREIKEENVDVDENHYRGLHNLDLKEEWISNTLDLNEEWTLKGVEELLTDSDELHVRNDFDAAAGNPDAWALDENPSSHLQSANFHSRWRALDQADSLVDEKPLLQFQMASSVLSFQRETFSSMEAVKVAIEARESIEACKSDIEASQSKEGCSVDAIKLTNIKPVDRCHEVVHSLSDPCGEYLQPNCSNVAQVVKVEPEPHVCSDEAAQQDTGSCQTSSPIQNTALLALKAMNTSSPIQSTALLAPRAMNTLEDSNPQHSENKIAPGVRKSKVQSIHVEPGICKKSSTSSHKPQLFWGKSNSAVQPDAEYRCRRKRSLRLRRPSHLDCNKAKSVPGGNLGLSTHREIGGQPKLHLVDKKRIIARNFPRSTNLTLGLQSDSKLFASTMRKVSLRKEADSQLCICEITAPPSNPSKKKADFDCCSGSSASYRPVSLDVGPKILENFVLSCNEQIGTKGIVKEDNLGHCRRTDPNQWQALHATRKPDLEGAHKGNVRATPLESNPLPPSKLMVDLNEDGLTQEACDSMTQVDKRQNSPSESILEDNATPETSNEGQPAGNFMAEGLIVSEADLPGVVEVLHTQPSYTSPQAGQASDTRKNRMRGSSPPMEGRQIGDKVSPQSKKASPPQKRMRGALAVQEDKQVGDAQLSSEGSPQATEQAFQRSMYTLANEIGGDLQGETQVGFDGPPKKMRGTLPVQGNEENGGDQADSKRCHRSDGKSWRCARECINGHYYCQYHLRARRIGYNRRKARDKDLAP